MNKSKRGGEKFMRYIILVLTIILSCNKVSKQVSYKYTFACSESLCSSCVDDVLRMHETWRILLQLPKKEQVYIFHTYDGKNILSVSDQSEDIRTISYFYTDKARIVVVTAYKAEQITCQWGVVTKQVGLGFDEPTFFVPSLLILPIKDSLHVVEYSYNQKKISVSNSYMAQNTIKKQRLPILNRSTYAIAELLCTMTKSDKSSLKYDFIPGSVGNLPIMLKTTLTDSTTVNCNCVAF